MRGSACYGTNSVDQDRGCTHSVFTCRRCPHPTLIPQKVTLEESGRRFSQRNPPGVHLSAAGNLSLPQSCHAVGSGVRHPKSPKTDRQQDRRAVPYFVQKIIWTESSGRKG